MATSNQHGLRKAIGAIKDSTKVGLAMVNSDKKGVDVAIMKATNHKEVVPKEKHVRTILGAVSTSTRSDAAFCIHALLKRLAKTHTWTVALKTLIIVHRILKHDPSFHQELINLGRDRGLLLNLAHFRDDSSPETWNYSVWVRRYALYLEERLQCFHVLKYDVDRDQSRNRRLDTPPLLEQLPVLQELLYRLLNCKPEGAALYSHLIHYVLSIIAGEGVKLYIAITDGILNLVDKYFEMQRHHATKALEIYRKAGEQASQLSEFFEICRSLHYGQGQKYLKIKPLPESFLIAMEDYLKEAPEVLALPYTSIKDDQGAAPTEVPIPESDLLIDYDQDSDVQEKSSPSVISSDQPQSDPRQGVGRLEIADLICFDDPTEEGSEQDVNNSLPVAIVETENPSYAENDVSSASASASAGWELALSGAPSSNGAAVTENKLTGGLDRSTLDGLFDQAKAITNQEKVYNFDQASTNPFDIHYVQDPFGGSSYITPPTDMQMAAMAQQLTSIMQQQQTPMAMLDYYSIHPSVEADYNQDPFYGSSYVSAPTDVQMADMAQQQTDLKHQPPLAMVGRYSTSPPGNPFVD